MCPSEPYLICLRLPQVKSWNVEIRCLHSAYLRQLCFDFLKKITPGTGPWSSYSYVGNIFKYYIIILVLDPHSISICCFSLEKLSKFKSGETNLIFIYYHKMSTMRKNQGPYNCVGLGEVENGPMVGVGWLWVLQMHYAQSCLSYR